MHTTADTMAVQGRADKRGRLVRWADDVQGGEKRRRV